ncbi:hypothetical protein GCM10009838_16470 [Catenulispora subtropica]|uniref:Uncharacterized protein n=1 Tax=Catenulispora subtropica TaxID=450798 RepID=A0ABP5CFS6_9ACTN
MAPAASQKAKANQLPAGMAESEEGSAGAAEAAPMYGEGAPLPSGAAPADADCGVRVAVA